MGGLRGSCFPPAIFAIGYIIYIKDFKKYLLQIITGPCLPPPPVDFSTGALFRRSTLFNLFDHNNRNSGYNGSTVINRLTFFSENFTNYIVYCSSCWIETKHCDNLRQRRSWNLNQSLYIWIRFQTTILSSYYIHYSRHCHSFKPTQYISVSILNYFSFINFLKNYI